MTPESLAKSNTEHAHQVALFAWCALNRSTYPELELLFAIPNGGARDKITAANLKAEGVKEGVLDLMLPVARGRWHGLFIEMKRPTSAGKLAGKPTPSQLWWKGKLETQSFAVAICNSWEMARETLITYLTWKG